MALSNPGPSESPFISIYRSDWLTGEPMLRSLRGSETWETCETSGVLITYAPQKKKLHTTGKTLLFECMGFCSSTDKALASQRLCVWFPGNSWPNVNVMDDEFQSCGWKIHIPCVRIFHWVWVDLVSRANVLLCAPVGSAFSIVLGLNLHQCIWQSILSKGVHLISTCVSVALLC